MLLVVLLDVLGPYPLADFALYVYVFVKMQGAQLQKHIDATLGSGNLREAVRLPPGEDINEWLAVNSMIHTFHTSF